MKLQKFVIMALVVAVATAQSIFAAAVERPSVARLVDTTSTSGAVSSASATHGSYPATNAFDLNKSNTSGRWLSNYASNMYVVYKFNEPTNVNGLNVVAGHDSKGGYNSAGRAPRTWTFEGSNDGEVWVVLDTQTSETSWSNGEERYYSFDNDLAYQYYKYDCTALNGATDYLQLWELEFYFDKCILDEAITRTAASTYSVSATLIEGTTADVSLVVSDGVTSVTNLIQEAVVGGSTFSSTISNLETDKTYQISLLVQAEDFAKENNIGIIYTGALALTNPVNANEAGLVPGGVTVSRANADAYPLIVNYTITSTDANAVEGTTWEAPVAVTIPAGSTSAVLPVVPIIDVNVNQNIILTISLADDNYEPPTDNAVNITLINREKLDIYDYANKRVITPSESALAIIGDATYNNFPVLLRLPVEVSEKFITENGRDLFIIDENEAELSFEIEAFNPGGETLVWVKVPALSAATQLTIFYEGVENYENVSTDVWNDFAGVWHYSSDEVGGTTIEDSTVNGLDGYPSTSGAAVSAYEEGPGGLPAILTSSTMYAPDYDSKLDNVAVFSASGWFKLPSQTSDHVTFISKKTGLAWNHATGWYLEMKQSKTKTNLILGGGTTSFSLNDVTQNWNYFNVVSDGTTVKVYINGSTEAVGTATYTITSSGKEATIGSNNGCFKEYRLRNSVATAEETALEYATVADAQFFTIDDESPVDAAAPQFAAPTVTRNADGTYSINFELVENTGDIGVIYESGSTLVTNMIATAAQPGTYTDTPTNLPEDKTYMAMAYGIATTGTEILKKGDIFYNGDISIEKLSDANEYKLVSGVFRISRADTEYDLVVNLNISGSAVEGQTYESLPTTVTIPEGSTYIDIEVTPMIDAATDADSSIVVSLAEGLYRVNEAAGSSEMTIINLVAPAGYNTWVAAEDGLASDPANWSKGRAPIASDNILFDGDFSSASCQWDAATTATVASWTQIENYSGTITVDTVFPEIGGFTCLTVAGDMEIAGGTITHNAHDATNKADVFRLRVNVGGNLTVGAAGSISAHGKGSYGPHTTHGVSTYGGGYNGSLGWGSLTEPYSVGSSPAADGAYTAPAGGAIWIEVTGNTAVEGRIASTSVTAWGKWNDYSGSGGAIYLKTARLSGTGVITADCTSEKVGSNCNSGAGGRISIVLTEGELDEFSSSNLYARAGKSSYGKAGGTGTILVRTPEKPNGVLYVNDRSNKVSQYGHVSDITETTIIPTGETWVLDEIVLGYYSIIRVQSGATLDLRGGLASVSSTATDLDNTGIIIDEGGNLILPEAETHTVSGKWIFQPNGITINGNLVVTDGAGVGTILLYVSSTNNVRKCSLTVTGDMTVDEGAYIRARRGGYIESGSATIAGDAYSCHGGQNAKNTTNVCYDSFFNPSHPGAFGRDVGWQNVGGGAVNLVVDGVLTLNGTATASSIAKEARCGAAGTINITAARLEGVGAIAANGSARNYAVSEAGDGSGGGGRIAIRLTDPGATFTEERIANINAMGYYAKKAGVGLSSSAGSVYLQDGSTKEGHGLIIIRNTGHEENNIAFTPIPSFKGGGENDDFRNAALSVEATAHVKLFADLKMRDITVAEGTTFDLNGFNYVVREANINGNKLGSGVYVATDSAVAGYVLDTSEGATGTLKVLGSALMIIVK